MSPRPYALTADKATDLNDPDRVIDENGALKKTWPNTEGYVFHPVDLCWYILGVLESYNATGDDAYLERATVNAQQLLDGAENIDGALWFPYDFDYVLHGVNDMPAPWFSGMAQGMALSVFTRMYEATGQEKWLNAANEAFKSFDEEARSDRVFVKEDDAGNLWFEEYVKEGMDPIHVINGHMYSMWGLYDYAMATGSQKAETLFEQGAATMENTFDQWRVPEEYSFYCASPICQDTGWQPDTYHRGVVRQLEDLALMTGHRSFLSMSEALKKDGIAAAQN